MKAIVSGECVSFSSSPYKFNLGLRTDHCSGCLQSIFHLVQSTRIQNIDTAPTVDQNFEYLIASNAHGDNQGILVQKCTTRALASKKENAILENKEGLVSTIG